MCVVRHLADCRFRPARVRPAVGTHDALADGVADEVRAVLGVQLRHDVRLVRLYRLDADEGKLGRDARIRVALGDGATNTSRSAARQVVAVFDSGCFRLPGGSPARRRHR